MFYTNRHGKVSVCICINYYPNISSLTCSQFTLLHVQTELTHKVQNFFLRA